MVDNAIFNLVPNDEEEEFVLEFGELTNVGRGGTRDFNELENRPQYNGETMTGETNIPEVPSKVSDLDNDSGYQTGAEVQTAIETAIGEIEIPTKTSDLTNDGSDGTSTYVEADDLAAVATSGDYNDLSNKPTIPTDTTYSAGNAITIDENDNNRIDAAIYPADYFTASASQNGNGTIFSLNNTMAATLKEVELYGDTEQQTYTGKNLFPYTLATLQSLNVGGEWTDNVYVWNGITYTINEDFTINVNGVTQEGAPSYLILNNSLSLTTGTEYILNGCPSGGSSQLYSLRLYDGGSYTSETGSGLSFTYGTQNLLRINIFAGITVNNLVFKPMIRLATIAGGSYEPYVGGVPSPNPEYPQDVNVVTGRQQVKMEGKNLWDPTPYQASHFIAADGTESTNPSVDTWGNIYVPAGTSMAVSATPGTSTSTVIRLHAFTLNGAWKEQLATLTLSNGNYGSTTFTTPNEPILLRWCGAKSLASYQLEYNTATAYEPYQSQTYTVDLGSTELCKIGTYQDYIYKSGDDWYVHKATGKYTFTGSETIGKAGNTNNNSYYYASSQNPDYGFTDIDRTHMTSGSGSSAIIPIYAKYFGENSSNNIVSTNSIGIGFNLSGATGIDCRIGVGLSSPINTADLLKTWLTNNTLSVYYPLATPTDTEITDVTLLSQLNALGSGKSYLDITDFSVTASGTNLSAILDVDVFDNSLAGMSGAIETKQDKLIAGENITIENNIISATGGSSINVVQTTGTSTEDVMSQNAVTSMIYSDPGTQYKIKIGAGTSSSEGANGVEIGHNAAATGNSSTALGYYAKSQSQASTSLGYYAASRGEGSVAIGAYSSASVQGQMDIGTSQTGYGYNSTNYRLLSGVYDGQSAHDAVTVEQVNATIDAINTALSTNIPHIGA